MIIFVIRLFESTFRFTIKKNGNFHYFQKKKQPTQKAADILYIYDVNICYHKTILYEANSLSDAY
jgi:hypothetical protein